MHQTVARQWIPNVTVQRVVIRIHWSRTGERHIPVTYNEILDNKFIEESARGIEIEDVTTTKTEIRKHILG